MAMKARFYKIFTAAVILSTMFVTACIKDLDTIPLDPDVLTAEKIYAEYNNYEKVLAKVYAGLAVSGQRGPDGAGDLSGLDEGFGQYTRAYFYAQELPTDEAILGWNDGNLRDYQEMDWSGSFTRSHSVMSLSVKLLIRNSLTEVSMRRRRLPLDSSGLKRVF